MLRSFDRQPRLVASTIVTALLLAVSAISPFSSSSALAVPLGSSDAVLLACNNTFAPVKFPLEYDVVARPSANPIAPGSSFTVTFDVTVKAAAAFLNGVYTALVGAGQPLADIPITEDVATIVPLTGATGPAVSARLASTFTIPKPAAVPVTADVNIPLGQVVGTYTANATGPVSFAFGGDAYMPAIPAVVGPPVVPAKPADPLPAGTTGFGWNIATPTPPRPASLTVAGQQTYTKVSLVNGLVTPFLVCMGGTWTLSPPVAPATTPSSDFPLNPPVGFASFAIGTGPQIIDPNATTTLPAATTVPTATTVPAATTVPTATTGPTVTTTPSTSGPSTSAPVVTVPSAPITNTATYTADCTNNVTPDHSALTYQITATAQSPVVKGSTITVTNQEWKVTVPAALVTTLRPVLPGGLDATSIGSLSATNAAPDKLDLAPVQALTALPASGDLVTVIHPADVSFVAAGTGDVVIAYAGSVTSVDIPSLFITAKLTCVPTGASPALLTVKLQGPVQATTTTVAAIAGPTTTRPLPAPVLASSGQIPRTGTNGSTLLVEIFGSLLIIQLGIMLWSAGQGRRRRRVA